MNRRARNEGSLTYLKSRDVWVASVFVGIDPKGKPIYRRVQRKQKTDAKKALDELRRALSDGKPIITSRRTVGSWLDEWLEQHIKPTHAPKTYSFYEANVRLHIRPALGSIELGKLSPSDVARFLNERLVTFEQRKLSEPRAPGISTVGAIRRTLRAALKKAVALGHTAYCPVNEATRPPRSERSQAKSLSPEEMGRLYAAVSGTAIERIVRFVLATGLRIGEATGIRWQDVDFGSRQVLIANQLQRVGGKLVLRPLKTEKSRRYIPLSEIALAALQDERFRQMVYDLKDETDIVFKNAEGRPFDPKNVDVHLKAALKRAKLPPMGMHALRHSAATAMLQNAVPMQVVSRMLGHSTINLTVDTYGHVLQDTHRAAIDVLDGAIRKHLPRG